MTDILGLGEDKFIYQLAGGNSKVVGVVAASPTPAPAAGLMVLSAIVGPVGILRLVQRIAAGRVRGALPSKRLRIFLGTVVAVAILALAQARADVIIVVGGTGKCDDVVAGKGKTGGLPAVISVNSELTMGWGFDCSISFSNGDAYSITGGKDSATSNAAGNSFSLGTAATVTLTAGGKDGTAADQDMILVSVSQVFATANNLLPNKFDGKVALSGTCSAGLGEKKHTWRECGGERCFAGKAKRAVQDGDRHGEGGDLRQLENQWPTLNPEPPPFFLNNRLLIQDAVLFTFEAGAPVNSAITEQSSVKLAIPEPSSGLAMSSGIAGLVVIVRRRRRRCSITASVGCAPTIWPA
jgi:hypothetical protein